MHLRMSPIAICKDAQLLTLYNSLNLMLHFFHPPPGVTCPRRNTLSQAGSPGQICVCDLWDIYPVECGELIEMRCMIAKRMVDENEITDILRIGWNLQLQGIFYCADAGNGMNRGANAANSLGEEPGFRCVSALKDLLKSPPHCAGYPSVRYFTVIHLDVDTQVSFNSRQRVNRDTSRHGVNSSFHVKERLVCRGKSGIVH